MCIGEFLNALLQSAILCLRNHKGTLCLPNLPVPFLCCGLSISRVPLSPRAKQSQMERSFSM